MCTHPSSVSNNHTLLQLQNDTQTYGDRKRDMTRAETRETGVTETEHPEIGP